LGSMFAAAGLGNHGWAGAVAGVRDRLLRREALEKRLEYLPFGNPLASLQLSSGFGAREGGHEGLDLTAPVGTPVLATGRGVVAVAGPRGPYGLMVELRHGEGMVTRYAHLDCLSVAEGAVVPLGAPLGEVGATGRTTGPHLHYEIRQGDRALDPLRFLLAGSS
ncbi:MAG: M23 family metallopeptidase, partial [Alphaproteobacteria bacterium]|nr:M23 family metallopeptidase [Alphaproteobacteria bacterium]